MQPFPLELLAPARDLACGLAAVNHGADAVYIGGPRFGARAAAGNSLQDIEKLVQYAHQYRARVYIALNTLFHDRELEEAVQLAHQLYHLGVDALIIQDMGLLECDLPPIALHASTQTNNRTAEKVRFLEQVGFQQVVLARELTLAEIRKIRAATTVALECFVHGALCVSYSGQCYISEAVCGRSANRGECAQFCRHRYTLHDAAGRVLVRDRYLLSLKDLDLSASLGELVDAGVSSFKIEGRLKDINYVKNITAHYRLLLDGLLDGDPHLARSSSGRCTFAFTPNPAKSFQRGKTEYFLHDRHSTPGQPDTSKSLGELLGRVQQVEKSSFTIGTAEQLSNGDGLCYFDRTGRLVGLKANRVAGNTVFHRERVSPPQGAEIYRNYDVTFLKTLAGSDQCRLLRIEVLVEETAAGLACTIVDEDHISSRLALVLEKELARQPGMIRSRIERQMQKSGGTLFQVERVRMQVSDRLFVPAAAINELRRLALAGHLEERLRRYRRQESVFQPNDVPWLSTRVTYLDNITNNKAAAFYRRHGVTEIAPALEGVTGEQDAALMTTRYCIRRQLGLCPKMKGQGNGTLSEPFTLTDNTGSYSLEFDCRRCEMIVRRPKGKEENT